MIGALPGGGVGVRDRLGGRRRPARSAARARSPRCSSGWDGRINLIARGTRVVPGRGPPGRARPIRPARSSSSTTAGGGRRRGGRGARTPLRGARRAGDRPHAGPDEIERHERLRDGGDRRVRARRQAGPARPALGGRPPPARHAAVPRRDQAARLRGARAGPRALERQGPLRGGGGGGGGGRRAGLDAAPGPSIAAGSWPSSVASAARRHARAAARAIAASPYARQCRAGWSRPLDARSVSSPVVERPARGSRSPAAAAAWTGRTPNGLPCVVVRVRAPWSSSARPPRRRRRTRRPAAGEALGGAHAQRRRVARQLRRSARAARARPPRGRRAGAAASSASSARAGGGTARDSMAGEPSSVRAVAQPGSGGDSAEVARSGGRVAARIAGVGASSSRVIPQTRSADVLGERGEREEARVARATCPRTRPSPSPSRTR